MSRFARLFVPAVAACSVVTALSQSLTVQVGAPPPPPLPLVNHGDSWRYHKGTNAPVVGWQTNADATLGVQWLTGNGGIGYNSDAATPNETTNCQTIVTDMQNNYRTLYMRRTFQVNSAIDPNARIRFTMDYDDAFVAYLDGVEVQRTANFSGTVGVEPSNTTLATSTHESSQGASGNAPVVYDLGAVGSRLSIGTHVFAIIGINGTTVGSSDLIMVPDLAVITTNAGAVANNGLYALTSAGSVALSGTNTLPGATRVVINGDDAVFNQGQGTWSNTVPLTPGFNRLFIAALGANGNMLSNLTQDIVYEPAALNVSGTLGGDTFWTNSSQVIHITSTVTISAGNTLTIGPGVVVILSPGASLLAPANGGIDVQGEDTREVRFLPAVSNVWNEIAADGANSFLTIRHADINRGAVKFRNGATGLLEDSYAHEYKNGTIPIAGCTLAAGVTVRRSHFSVYHETLWQDTLMTVEDNVFENADDQSSDALDFDGAKVGSVIRRCTFRFGMNTNTDAIDIGPTTSGSGSTNTIIEGCLMHDFPYDKGVSIGEGSYGIVIRNCVIHHTESGVGVKNSPPPPPKPPCTAIIYNTTITDCEFGFRCYHKQDPNSPTDGGQITNAFNNIVWGNLTNIGLYNAGIAIVDYSDIGATNWPGTGNIDVNPLFVNPAIHDYRVQPGSPTIGAGMGGTNLGPLTSVGGIPMWVSNLVAVSSGTNAALSWVETADNETGFRIERSTDKVAWSVIGNAGPNATSFADATGLAGVKYYYRVRATNDLGVSPYSNIASARNDVIVAGGNVGGTITQNTCWAAGGVFTVTSSVTVANGVTLTIKPGATIQFNSGLSLTVANGGKLLAEGASNAPILFTHNAAGTWGHLVVNGAPGSPETRIAYARFEFNNTSPCIQVSGGTVFLDHLTFANTAQSYLHLDDASFIVQNCEFPTATASFENVHGTGGIKSGGHGIFTRNFFGATIGYNDVVDFTGGNRPSPIVQFLDNVFVGSDDDELDLDGTDAWVEGNIFLHAHKNGSPDTASGVSGGDDSGNTSEITVVGNLFFDCDHAAMAKGGNFYTFLNNTVVHQTKTGGTDTDGAVFCLADEGFAEATGMFIEGNIIYDAEKLTRFYTNSAVTMSNNLMPFTWAGAGGNNSASDPLLAHIPLVSETIFTNWASAQIMKQWFKPQSNSPAIATGPNGLDRGGVVPIGASLSGEPGSPTTNTSATLVVSFNRAGSGIPTGAWPAGSGYTNYKYRVDGGAWSAPRPIALPIVLSSLTNGSHFVEVSGQRDAGLYQDDSRYGPVSIVTRSRNWIVGLLDTDGDGMPDDWEDAHLLNRFVNDAGDDADSDGMSNLAEYLAGTDPQSSTSRLWLQSLPATGSIAFSFEAVAGKGYTVQSRTSLSTGIWLHLADFNAVPTNRTVQVTNTVLDPARFYRVTTPIVP